MCHAQPVWGIGEHDTGASEPAAEDAELFGSVRSTPGINSLTPRNRAVLLLCKPLYVAVELPRVCRIRGAGFIV